MSTVGPKVVLFGDAYRAVKVETKTGYFLWVIEHRGKDSLGADSWIRVDVARAKKKVGIQEDRSEEERQLAMLRDILFHLLERP